MKAVPARRPLALLLALFLGGCASPPPPGPETPLSEGLALYGEVRGEATESEPLVVILRDRHVLHGSITRIRGAQRRLQRQNRDAIAFLLTKGFRFLGCEYSQGPLPDGDGPERFHRRRAQEIIDARDDLSAWTLYQPIRYEIEFGDRLTVAGVEDPELYEGDTERLAAILNGRRARARRELSDEERRAVRARERGLLREIRRNVDLRGRRAAEILLETLEERGETRGILMLGGAHAPGAIEGLDAAGVSWLLFTPRSYEEPSR